MPYPGERMAQHVWQAVWSLLANRSFLITEQFIFSYLSIIHRRLIEVQFGAYRPLDGQHSFRNALLLQRVQTKGLIEGLTQFSATEGPGSHYPSLKIPRLDFCVFVQQQGCTTKGCPLAGTCCV